MGVQPGVATGEPARGPPPGSEPLLLRSLTMSTQCMLGVTSSLGCATGQDDEPDSSQQRVGCTSADQSLDMRILASLYLTMILPVALLSSVVETSVDRGSDRSRRKKEEGGLVIMTGNQSISHRAYQ